MITEGTARKQWHKESPWNILGQVEKYRHDWTDHVESTHGEALSKQFLLYNSTGRGHI